MQYVHNFFKVECCVALLLFHSFTFMSTKNIIEQLQSARKSFFSVITVNVLHKDKGLIHVKGLEKVQHIESVYLDRPSH